MMGGMGALIGFSGMYLLVGMFVCIIINFFTDQTKAVICKEIFKTLMFTCLSLASLDVYLQYVTKS